MLPHALSVRRVFISFLLPVVLSGGGLLAQPVAQFTANTTKGCGSLTVQFTDQSTGSNLTYLWNFGDGKTSTLKNPVNIYTGPGVYTVTLTVTNAGGSDAEVKTAYIVVHKLPSPKFSADDTVGCEPFTVRFTDLSAPGDTTLLSWLWSFGDGNSSTQRHPVHTYAAPGSFQVSLLVTDHNGCMKEAIVPGYITVHPSPKASFDVATAQSCIPPITATFTNTTTGSSLTYLWDFGDGSPASTAATPPPHTYSVFGSYTITLVASNTFGCTDTATRIVDVRPYTADFSMNAGSGCTPVTVGFSDSSSAGTDNWSWDFGDGSTSTAMNPVHVFATPGTYVVRLIARNDKLGCADTVFRSVTIFPLPVADFALDDSVGCALPFGVSFTNLTPGGVQWSWDFGDSTAIDTGSNPFHTFTGYGPYFIKLTVTDTNGCVNTSSGLDSIYVTEPMAGFDGGPKSFITGIIGGCAPFTANFTDLSISYENIVGWNWIFGDGATDTVPNPIHTYIDTGRYTVTLVIENADGCFDTLVMTDFVRVGQKPAANLFTTDTLGCHKYSVQFRDTSSGPVNEWYWNFGDGQTSYDQHPNHIYADTGYFTVTLIAGHNGCFDTLVVDSLIYVWPPHPEIITPPVLCDTSFSITFIEQSKGADTWFWDFGDGNTFTGQFPPPHKYGAPGTYTVKLVNANLTYGCKDSAEVTVYVSEIITGFTVDTIAGCEPFTATFTDTSTSNYPFDYWKWVFGDGDSVYTGTGSPPYGTDTITGNPLDTGTYKDPVHIYLVSGIYNVKLVVRNSVGCYDTLENSGYIDVKALPNAYFTADTTYGCAPLTVLFSDTSQGQAGMGGWTWNFGDGTTDSVSSPVHTYTTRGVYTVSLTVVDSNNCMGAITKTNYILPTYPYPAFTFPAVVCSGDSLTVTNASTGSGLTYTWNFGDGSLPDTSVNPRHIYYTDTTTVFYISLTAVDSNGCDSTLVWPVTISKPKAGFGADNTLKPCPPFFVNFSDSSSSDVTNWYWDFGNGSNSFTPNTSLGVYNLAGVYDVGLIVTNGDGCTDTLVRDSLIWVGGPSAVISFTRDSTGCLDWITFVADTVNTVSLTWFFGDGTSDASADSVIHRYAPGIYHPVLTIVDSIGCTVNIVPNDSIIILPKNIKANFTYTPPDTVYAKDPVDFTDLSSGNPTSWWWDFGDGGTSGLRYPGHIFKDPGLHIIMLIANDAFGCPDTTYKTIFVDDGIIDIPNVFTPNGDGINDWFKLPSAGLVDFTFTIYNRWGIIVFTTHEPEIGWDGKTVTGIDVPEGTYYYILRSNSVLEKVYDLKGYITLVR